MPGSEEEKSPIFLALRRKTVPDLDKIQFTMVERRRTTRKVLFDEKLGDQEYSEFGPAIESLYIYQDALSLICTDKPARIKVTIEPV